MNLFHTVTITLAFLLSPRAYAQSPAPLVFPIVELGNCENKAACKAYCDLNTHQTACQAFAKEHGLENKASPNLPETTLLQKARESLGCADLASCKTMCSLKENFQKCSEFAKKNNLPGGQKPLPDAQTLLPLAKSLGINAENLDQLRQACNESQLKEACTQLAKKAGIQGGLRTPPPSPRPSSLPEVQKERPSLPPSERKMNTELRTLPPASLRPRTQVPTQRTGEQSTTPKAPLETRQPTYRPTIQTQEPRAEAPLLKSPTGLVQGAHTELSLPEYVMTLLKSFLGL